MGHALEHVDEFAISALCVDQQLQDFRIQFRSGHQPGGGGCHPAAQEDQGHQRGVKDPVMAIGSGIAGHP